MNFTHKIPKHHKIQITNFEQTGISVGYSVSTAVVVHKEVQWPLMKFAQHSVFPDLGVFCTVVIVARRKRENRV